MPAGTADVTRTETGTNHHQYDPEGLRLIFVVSDDWLPGQVTAAEAPGVPVAGADSSSWGLEQWEKAGAVSQLTREEQLYVLTHPIVLSRTYSMQQSDFERHGFPVTSIGGSLKVVVPSDVQLIGLGTRDRYGIFAAQGLDGVRAPITFEDVAEWQASEFSWQSYRDREIGAASR